MESVDLSDFERLNWLVESRSKIQRLSLDILTLLRTKQTSSSDDVVVKTAAGLLVGIAFSLWRAVFLTHGGQKREDNLVVAERYLEKVLRDNQIIFSDDREMKAWTFGYYMNNVRYRVRRLCEEMPELDEKLQTAGLRDYFGPHRHLNLDEASYAWNICYQALETSISCLSARLENPEISN